MKRNSIGVKIISVVFISAFTITALLGLLSFSFSKARLISMIGESIKGIALTTANSVNRDDVLAIITASERRRARYFPHKEKAFSTIYGKALSGDIKLDEGSLDAGRDIFNKYVKLLSNIKSHNNIDGPINVYIREGKRLKLVLSSDQAVIIGAQYKISPTAEAVLLNGSAQATGIYRDKDGSWISAYAPVPSGIEMIIEVNYKIDSYMAKLSAELWVILLTCLTVFLLSILTSYYFVNRSVSAIKRLNEIANDLEKEKYDISIDIKSGDEVGHLAETFEKLRVSIKRKISELKLSLAREKRAHLESIIALTNAMGLKDPYLRQHPYRVEKYALLIAKALGLPHGEIEILRYGCYLHDIGKLGLESVLLQKVKLSKDDFEQVKRHSERGAKIVEGIGFLDDVRDIILHHQEHYDGTGYPSGLKGEEIPLLARIVALADAFDAMTTDRPYKARMSFAAALEAIVRDSGIQFDPKISDAFLKYRNNIEAIARKHFKKI